MKTIKPVESKEGSINIVYVEAVHMPNGEVICNGKSILFVNDDNQKYVYSESPNE